MEGPGFAWLEWDTFMCLLSDCFDIIDIEQILQTNRCDRGGVSF